MNSVELLLAEEFRLMGLMGQIAHAANKDVCIRDLCPTHSHNTLMRKVGAAFLGAVCVFLNGQNGVAVVWVCGPVDGKGLKEFKGWKCSRLSSEI